MQGKLHQYHLTRALAKKYSHTTYLASPTNEPEHQVILTVFASWLFYFAHESENVLQKAQRIQECEHPHLIPILDVGIEDEQPFVVREYLPHGSLRSRMAQIAPNRLELADALTILFQVGEALAYAHKRNIIHGNIKPENILFDVNGQAVLTDFYLVSRKDALIRDQTSEEYAFCYLAPEQFASIGDARSDQYALGCLAYELITGRVPFAAQTLASIMGHQSNTLPKPLSESVADLPASLEAAVLKTLAKDPAKRFFDLSLFLEVIQSALLPVPTFPLSRTAASHKRRTISRRTRRPKARTFLSSPHPITASSRSAPELSETETMQQPEEPIAVTNRSVFDSDQRDTRWPISQKTTNDSTRYCSMDMERKPVVGEMSFAQLLYDFDQADAQQEVDDESLSSLFAEQESNDLPAIGSASLGPEQIEAGREKKYETILSPRRDRPVSRRAQPSRSKVFGLVLLCLIVVASGTYAAVFLSGTSKPEMPVRPTQGVSQVRIPVQKDISPTQLITPTATAQPAPRITTYPIVVPTPTPTSPPMPTPTSPPVTHLTTIDDRVLGTGLNQFNYVGSGWKYCKPCGAPPNLYDVSNTWGNSGYVTVTFTGIQIKFYGVLDTGHGFGAVSIDGGEETMVDFYGTSQVADQLLWTSPLLPAGTHTFKLRVTGTKDPRGTDHYLAVDRVDILS